MSKSQNFLRKVFLQKKLIQNTQCYPYTYIFQYNNISGNDWKQIKNNIHTLQNLKKMNLQVVPSKLRRPLNNSTNSALFFSKIEGSKISSFAQGACCILSCGSPQDLETFYKIVLQTCPQGKVLTDKKEFNPQFSSFGGTNLGSHSFIHLALQVNSLESSPNILTNLTSLTNDTLSIDSEKSNSNMFLNSLEIQKRLTLTFAGTYGEFFSTLHTKTTQVISIPEVLNQHIFFLTEKSATAPDQKYTAEGQPEVLQLSSKS